MMKRTILAGISCSTWKFVHDMAWWNRTGIWNIMKSLKSHVTFQFGTSLNGGDDLPFICVMGLTNRAFDTLHDWSKSAWARKRLWFSPAQPLWAWHALDQFNNVAQEICQVFGMTRMSLLQCQILARAACTTLLSRQFQCNWTGWQMNRSLMGWQSPFPEGMQVSQKFLDSVDELNLVENNLRNEF